MKERFPDVEWWCDNCRAYLNNQAGFNDHKYIWQCTECGYKNSISSSNIFETHPAPWNRKDKDPGEVQGR